MADERIEVTVAVLDERVDAMREDITSQGTKIDTLIERIEDWAETSRKGHAAIEKRLDELETTVGVAKTAGAWLARKGLPIFGLLLAGGFFGEHVARAAKWIMGER